jgi:predicted nucleic acid-binding protein
MFLVDTNILSDSTKPASNPQIVAWLRKNEPLLYVSVISLGEIHRGIELLAEGRKKAELRKWFVDLRHAFSDSILPIDEPVVMRWGEMIAQLEKRGRKIPVIDGLLAATALEHGLTVVTANTKDFVPSGVRTYKPN